MAKPTPFDVGDIWESISQQVSHDGDCWTYQGRLDGQGYGGIAWFGEYFLTHRVAYQALAGDIPEGLQLDHLCRNRACCNPDHLEPVTCRENLMRGETIAALRAGQTHCIHGHEFTPENTIVRPKGNRDCRECARRRKREYKARKKLAA